jgi:hypothetical protein
MPKFRKKPVLIEAVLYDEMAARLGWGHEIMNAHPWLDEAYENDVLSNVGKRTEAGHIADQHLTIKTLEGIMRADPGDWIIRGVKGEIYPCKPDIFAETYDVVAS